MPNILIEDIKIADLPVLIMKDQLVESGPLVFFSHGAESDRRQGIPLGYELAARGFIYVSLDSIYRGLRGQDSLDPGITVFEEDVFPVDCGLDGYIKMHQMIAQTGKDIARLIEHFKNDPRVNSEAIGLVGYSMGGHVAFHSAVETPDIQAVVSVSGIPAFTERWNDLLLETSTYPRWAEQLEKVQEETDRRTSFIQQIDPIDKLKEFYPKPLLMISGEIDTVVPKKYNLDLYNKLIPVYKKDPDKLDFIVNDGIGHVLTPAMINDICNWFMKFL